MGGECRVAGGDRWEVRGWWLVAGGGWQVAGGVLRVAGSGWWEVDSQNGGTSEIGPTNRREMRG